MTFENNTPPPEAAFHPARQGQIAALFMLGLFFVTFNMGAVLFQARNVPPEHHGNAVIGYFCGVVVGALWLGWLQSRRAWATPGGRGALLRAVLLGVLLLPSVFFMFSFQVTGYSGTAFSNAFHPFLWAMHPPAAMLFFFGRVRPGQQAVFYCAAISAGYLCWALLMPLVGAFGPGGSALALPTAGLEGRYLPLINVVRNLTGAAFALLCWHLARTDAARPPGPYVPGPFPARRFVLLLLPFLACFFLNGFSGYLFFPRLIGRGLYPEYMHLALALLFPLVGLYISRRGDAALFRLLLAAVAIFAVFPLLFFVPGQAGPEAGQTWTAQAVYLVCAVAQQVLECCGVLAFARFAGLSRFPVLALCTVWLAVGAAIPGKLTAAKLLPALGVPVFPAACILTALCALSLLPLRRAFPLPEAPAEAETVLSDAGREAMSAEAAKLEVARLEAEARFRAFAAAFGFSKRETEVLDGILRGLEREAIGAELGVSDRTVKHHINGLLKKTGQANRQRLLHFYTGWQAG